MTPEQIEHMTQRFLQWRFPSNFNPDGGIRYMRPNYAPNVDATPVGTNLLDYNQAKEMVLHMVQGLGINQPPAMPSREEVAKIIRAHELDPSREAADAVLELIKSKQERG